MGRRSSSSSSASAGRAGHALDHAHSSSASSMLWSFLAFSLFSLLAFSLSVHVFQAVQPTPYMDEIFHVPQAQKYCQERFLEWDPKITTLPGLYVLSIGVLRPLQSLMTGSTNGGGVSADFCDVFHLRAVNLLLASLTFLLLKKVTSQIHGNKHYYSESKALLSSFNLSLFPLLFFFSFLYYTDVGSTMLVLLMYSLHLENRDWLASLVGLLSIIFRQTNIVWVAFVAVQSVGPLLIASVHARMLESPLAHGRPIKFSLKTAGQARELLEGVALLLCEPPRLLHLLGQAMGVAGGYLAVWLCFLTFVVVNEGVAVGDRHAHQAVFHPMQLCYFVAFSAALSLPFSLPKLPSFLQFGRRHFVFLGLALLTCVGLAHSHSYAHPYLLADNRHYTFYLWRRVVTRTAWAKYALAPGYLFAGYCVLHALRRTDIVFRLTFPAFVAINLTPQRLLEFRYFVVPYLLYRLQVRPETWWKLWAELALYAFVNAVTIGLFALKPFRWDHDPEELQRFIW